jgi:hypothetical protein
MWIRRLQFIHLLFKRQAQTSLPFLNSGAALHMQQHTAFAYFTCICINLRAALATPASAAILMPWKLYNVAAASSDSLSLL